VRPALPPAAPACLNVLHSAGHTDSRGPSLSTRRAVRAPGLVIPGAARSGTSLLASFLGDHPRIDAGSVKESNYFSREFERGPLWYESLYGHDGSGAVRLDASVSYTYPQYPEALDRLAAAAPDAHLVYVVRHPLERIVSHYLFYRHYFENEQATTLEEALAARPVYAGASDYGHWLDELQKRWPLRQLLVAPFPRLTADLAGVADVICDRLGLPRMEGTGLAVRHQNNTVQFRHPALRRVRGHIVGSRAYPRLRSWLGPHRVRRVRNLMTKRPDLPSTEQVLASISEGRRRELEELAHRADTAVRTFLLDQDQRTGLDWSLSWPR
jgi:hypothetical protein